MIRRSLAFLLMLSLAGCGAAQKPAATSTAAPAVDSSATAAPKEIVAVFDQKLIYECPECGMDFDGPGTCSMDHAGLVPKQVSYICPADDKPVDHAGSCPRCAANARVVKSPVAGIVN